MGMKLDIENLNDLLSAVKQLVSSGYRISKYIYQRVPDFCLCDFLELTLIRPDSVKAETVLYHVNKNLLTDPCKDSIDSLLYFASHPDMCKAPSGWCDGYYCIP